MRLRYAIFLLLSAVLAAPSLFAADSPQNSCDPADATAEVQVGDRLFRETRFSQYFFANSHGDVNARLGHGDPVVEMEASASGQIPDPFRGESINCRNCHLGDDLIGWSKYAGRTYCDFARRSPIPARAGGQTITARNAQMMVNLTRMRGVPQIFHYDGEFANIEDLVTGTLTGREFGWTPAESQLAVGHIVNVIRGDDGKGPLAQRYGCGGFSYKTVMLGTDPRLPSNLRLPARYRIDVMKATDTQVMHEIGVLIHAYMDSIFFDAPDQQSPYDVFLKKNRLPEAPAPGESNREYSERLLSAIDHLQNPIWVIPKDGHLELHRQVFQFGPGELRGMKIFMRRPEAKQSVHAGNCASCHTPPNFTDNIFHNNGASQAEYDAIFGRGAFAALKVPALAHRNADFDSYLPPSPRHPHASSRFRSPPSIAHPGYADLGLWNIFANPDVPEPQPVLDRIVCGEFDLAPGQCQPAAVLPMTVGFFKTPTVKDLGQSAPYMHTGAFETIQDVVAYYIKESAMARGGEIRNASPEISEIAIEQSDVAPLSAFLDSLNEDYH